MLLWFCLKKVYIIFSLLDVQSFLFREFTFLFVAFTTETMLIPSNIQILAFFLRPNKDSKYRSYWNWYHHWFGRLALFFTAVNIVIGIRIGDAGNSWKIGYGFNLAVLLTASIILEVLLWTRWSKRNNPSF